MNTGTKVTTGDTVTTHDIDIELPPLPSPIGIVDPESTTQSIYGMVDMAKYATAYARAAIEPYAKRIAQLEAARFAYASEFPPNEDGDPDVGSIHENIRKLKAELEADRKRRGEPVCIGHIYYPVTGGNAGINWTITKDQGVLPRNGEPVYVGSAPQPAEHSRSEHGASTTQVLITLGKVIAGYRPGEEGWSEYDQQAYDAAMSAPQPLSESDIPAEPEPCFCDRMYPDSNPDVSCGDCPTRDYKEPMKDSVDIDDLIAVFIARGDITKDAFLEARQWVRDTYYNPAEPVEVDDESSVPSDDALDDALSNLEHDNYELSYSGYKNRQADIALIRAALARYK